jgi:3-hydroxyacyl-CoA dehydrogenase/3a,7a,12a-trihydroxy-5b-cholest-24-enoyl-CoA hydratase
MVAAETQKRTGPRGQAAPKIEKEDAPAATSSTSSTSSSRAPQAAAIFAALGKRLAEQPDLAAQVGAVVQFHLTDPASSWTVDLTSAPPCVEAGQSSAAAVTLSLRDADLAALASGSTLQQLYQRGLVRLDGDVAAARRFTLLRGLA